MPSKSMKSWRLVRELQAGVATCIFARFLVYQAPSRGKHGDFEIVKDEFTNTRNIVVSLMSLKKAPQEDGSIN